jgi:hypothetical protein
MKIFVKGRRELKEETKPQNKIQDKNQQRIINTNNKEETNRKRLMPRLPITDILYEESF